MFNYVYSHTQLKMTPLHWAVQKRHKNIVEMLLKHNANPNFVSKFGKTPIIIAHETGQLDILKMLEDAVNFRVENPTQTQEATDNLLFEMQQTANVTEINVSTNVLHIQYFFFQRHQYAN